MTTTAVILETMAHPQRLQEIASEAPLGTQGAQLAEEEADEVWQVELAAQAAVEAAEVVVALHRQAGLAKSPSS